MRMLQALNLLLRPLLGMFPHHQAPARNPFKAKPRPMPFPLPTRHW
jgi:hypothetical protein